MTKLYRTLVQIEILTDVEPDNVTDLDSIHYEITEGHASGIVSIVSTEEVDGPTMVRLLKAQGSDPEFLGLDDDGNQLDDFENVERCPVCANRSPVLRDGDLECGNCGALLQADYADTSED